LVIAAALTASAADFHVAPNGDDANPGTAAKPFASLTRVRDAVCSAKFRAPIAITNFFSARASTTFHPMRPYFFL
jgi:hypothetical protein